MSAGSAADDTTARASLSRATVLNQALRMVEQEGPASLTMRRLGAALGVEAMSLYYHVHNKDDLLDGLAEVMVKRLPHAALDRPWEDGVRAFATGIRRIALRHPAAFQLVGMRPLDTDTVVRPVATLLIRLQHAGLSPQAAVAAYRLLASFARGFALAEIAGFTLAAPAADHPGVAEHLAPFAPALYAGHDRAFRAALDIIVDGIATQTTSAPRARGGRRS
jgi:TetR/AcrR family transcriptional regulator, tetracycline repressor protein